MRVTENRLLESATVAVTRARNQVAEAGAAVQTGVRVALPSQDPVAWSQAARTEARQAASAGRGGAIARAGERLRETDRAFAGIGEALARIRELTVQVGSDLYGAAERAGAAAEVRALQAHLLGLANTRGPDGEYLLGGTASATPPFGPDGAYLGNGARRTVEVAEGVASTVSLTGEALTAAAGVDVFAVLTTLTAALDANDGAAIRATLSDIGTAVAQVARARTDVGSHASALDAVELARQEFDHSLALVREQAVGADPIAAASALAQSTVALQSAQAVADHVASRVFQR